MSIAAVAVGSNVDPLRNVPEALDRVAAIAEVLARSPVYATPAVGADGEPDGNPEFHNAVVLIHTDAGPLELRQRLRTIEADLGRRRTDDDHAPRPIDLDIVFYDSVIVITESVAIPDSDALTHPHIAVPLADVAPDWRPPGGSRTAAQAAAGHELPVVG